MERGKDNSVPSLVSFGAAMKTKEIYPFSHLDPALEVIRKFDLARSDLQFRERSPFL